MNTVQYFDNEIVMILSLLLSCSYMSTIISSNELLEIHNEKSSE